jgi:trimeric autotransporter adhesin
VVKSATDDAFTVVAFPPHQQSLITAGWVGIGTNHPAAALHVVGDVIVEDADLLSVSASHVQLGLGTVAGGAYSIAGGISNAASAPASFMGAGAHNSIAATADQSAIVSGFLITIGGGSTNAFIGAGTRNAIQDNAPDSVIVAGVDNQIGPQQRSSFIGGGARNEIGLDNQHAVIVGGRDNRIGTNTLISLIVGGAQNSIGDNVDGGLIVCGNSHSIDGGPSQNGRVISPLIVGGSDNRVGIDSSQAVILGGYKNGIRANSEYAAVLGGYDNHVGTNSSYSLILGGYSNDIDDNCNYSLAAGRDAQVDHEGAFVWADAQRPYGDFHSAGSNTFNIRAQGGVHLNDDTSQFFGTALRQMLNLWGTDYGVGVQSSTLYQRSPDRFSWFQGGVHSNTENTPGTNGTLLMTLTANGLVVNGTFVSASDRNAKEAFAPVNPGAVLDKVLALPVSQWRYKADEERSQHLGPMAQDFHAAFNLGADDKHIAAVDADGVALAAIQGLNQKVEEENAALRAELKARDAILQSLQQRLQALEQTLPKRGPK